MTDSLKERLRLGGRNASSVLEELLLAALDRIEELERINLAQSKQVAEKLDEFQEAQAKFQDKCDDWDFSHKPLAADSLKERLREAANGCDPDPIAMREAFARIEELEKQRDNYSEMVSYRNTVIAKLEGELRDTKTLLAGQSARMIDLELAVSRLGEELKEKEKQLDQTILCWQDDKRTAKLNWDNAKTEIERLRASLESTIRMS